MIYSISNEIKVTESIVELEGNITQITVGLPPRFEAKHLTIMHDNVKCITINGNRHPKIKGTDEIRVYNFDWYYVCDGARFETTVASVQDGKLIITFEHSQQEDKEVKIQD